MTTAPEQSYLRADLARSQATDGVRALSKDERIELELGLIAKGVCSGLFVSGRTLSAITERVVEPVIDSVEVTLEIDREAGTVDAAVQDRLRRRAVFVGDQGAVLLPPGARDVAFTPRALLAPLERASSWPASQPVVPSTVDADALSAAVDLAFEAQPDPHTTALLIAWRGQLVAERYGADAGAQMPLAGWSLGKTLTALLIGRLIHFGALGLDDPAPVPAWQGSDDPRRAVRVRDLLQMAGGLAFTASWAPDYDPSQGYPDHSYMYTGGIDVFDLAVSCPLAHAPGTFGAYKNSDTMVLGYLVREGSRALGEDYLCWPQRALFEPLGLERLTLETDPHGNFVTSGHVFGTGRDWLRLGQLLLGDGVWQGERLLPPGYTEFLRTPAPAWRGRYLTGPGPADWHDAIYGGHLWLNRYPPADRWPLPKDACFMLGMGGQYVFVVPSLELVIVRLGDPLGAPLEGRGALPDALRGIVAALEP
ncbi:MAG: serine hydrolase [Pseudomonadota bacterium]